MVGGPLLRVFLQVDSRESPRFALRIARPSKVTGKIDFGTGTGWKAFFDFFFSLILDPPPGTCASTAKKGNFIGTGHSFPVAWLF